MSFYEEHYLIGQLNADSPALTADLKRVFDERAVRFLSLCYSEAAKWGGLRETPVLREPGVSYNPRPARVAKILLKETATTTVFALSVAFFSTVPEQFQEALQQQFCKQRLALTELKTLETCDEGLQNIVFARALDDARHLHLTSYSYEEQLECFENIRRNVNFWTRVYKNSGNEALFQLLEQWLAQSKDRFYSCTSEA